MLPPLIPGGLGELGPCPVDRLYGRRIADAVMVRGDADYRAVFLVEGDVFTLEMSVTHAIEVP